MCFSQLIVTVWKGDPLTEGEGPGEGQIVYKKRCGYIILAAQPWVMA